MRLFIAISTLMTLGLLSCNKEKSTGELTQNKLQGEWQYMSFVSGEGPQCFYDRGDKIYTFSSTKLFVEDNYELHNVCVLTFLAEGEYTYEVLTIDDVEYLYIDEVEQGRIHFVDGDLLIESGFTSNEGELEDAPTFRLVR